MHSNSFRYSVIVFVFLCVFCFFSNSLTTAQTKPAKKPRTTTGTAAGGTTGATTNTDSRSLVQPAAEEKKAVETPVAPAPIAASKVKKVMVTDFDSRGIVKWWGTNWDIGSLFANSIVGPLSRSSSYEVVERTKMNELFTEQGLIQDERFNQSSVTKIGRLLGADYILFGYLTDFTRKRSSKIVYSEVSAQVAFSARMVDVATGKIVKSVEITYSSPKQKEMSLTKETTFNPNDPEFLQSIFGKAIKESSAQAVAQLTGEATAQPTASTGGGNSFTDKPVTAGNVVIQGKIADVSGNIVTINRGQQHGVREGQFFALVKIGKEIKDPDTGEVIKRQTEELARIKITKVDEKSAEGVVVSGNGSLVQPSAEIVSVDSKKQ